MKSFRLFVISCIVFFVGMNTVYSQDTEAFFSSIYKGDLAGIKSYLDAGGDVKIVDKSGCSPLFLAAYLDQEVAVEVITLLLDKGVDINYQDSTTQQTALMNACFNGNLEAVKLLIEKGADASLKDMVGETALDIARIKENKEIVKFLMLQRTTDPKRKAAIERRLNRK